MTNPLLAEWTGPHEMPPFAQIRDDQFAQAVEAGLAEARANIAAIAEDQAAPTFANTIEALELADAKLGRVLSVFYNLSGADSTPAREALSRDFSPLLSAYSSEVSMNAALFARIETLWEQRDTLDLTDEQQRLLFITRRGFVRQGAQLEGFARDRLASVKARLAVLGTQFSQNLLADERGWSMRLDEADLGGLP
ncbi:hypothetical protein LCGC14_2684440, partial [marine sediment metagenome]